jgi:hypothetical protein
VPVVAADLEAEEPWLATAYAPGPSLQHAVGERGPLPADEVLALTARVAEALETIHAAGVIHRDLKPSSIVRTYAPVHRPTWHPSTSGGSRSPRSVTSSRSASSPTSPPPVGSPSARERPRRGVPHPGSGPRPRRLPRAATPRTAAYDCGRWSHQGPHESGREVDPDDERDVAVITTVERQLKPRRRAVGMRAGDLGGGTGLPAAPA